MAIAPSYHVGNPRTYLIRKAVRISEIAVPTFSAAPGVMRCLTSPWILSKIAKARRNCSSDADCASWLPPWPPFPASAL